MHNRAGIIAREGSVLVIIDIQERLLAVMADPEKVRANTVRLLNFAKIIGLPVILTEQKNLGPTVPEIRAVLPEWHPIQKLSFSCFLNDEFVARLNATGKRTLLIAGIECHVCVTQTALHALEQGYKVHIISDAVSSRTPENCRTGIERCRDAGAVITGTEMLIFELLERAGTDEFRAARMLFR